MRWVCTIALGGCGFGATLASDPVVIDAPVDTGGSEIMVDARVAPFCDPLETALVGCWELEGTTADGSPNQLSTTMTNVTFVAGRVGQAMQFGATSAADVVDSVVFDSVAVTVEAWIKPSQIPGAGERAGIADMNGQWGLFVHEQGRLQCTMINGISMQIDAMIPINAWTHAACTYENGTTTIYVNGVMRFQMGGGGALATGGTTGVSIGADNPPGSGSRLSGLIDQFRLLSRARTPAEIACDAAVGPC